jgi:hypothetical protein
VAEVVEFGRHRFAVMEMDGRRVARVRVTPFGDGAGDPGAADGVAPREAASDEVASTEA